MQTLLRAAACAAAVVVCPLAAQAGVVFSNSPSFTGGDDSFTTAYSTAHGVDDFTAQHFNLAAGATVQYASFDEYDHGVVPTGVTWLLYQDDGAGGLPGTAIASGTSPLVSSTAFTHKSGFDVSRNIFALPATSLAPGGYYLALQATTTTVDDYLADGVASSGEALSTDGTASWAYDPRGRASVAVALYDSFPRAPTPEPAAWAMMLMGVLGLGAALRGRQAKLSAMAE
jgi:hypothetical protein